MFIIWFLVFAKNSVNMLQNPHYYVSGHFHLLQIYLYPFMLTILCYRGPNKLTSELGLARVSCFLPKSRLCEKNISFWLLEDDALDFLTISDTTVWKANLIHYLSSKKVIELYSKWLRKNTFQIVLWKNSLCHI